MSGVVARLRELEAAATPGPWEYSDDEHGRFLSWPDIEENDELIAAARNALPQLLAIAEAVPAILAMLDAYTLVLRQLPYEHRARVRLRDMQRDLRDALAALDSQETE